MNAGPECRAGMSAAGVRAGDSGIHGTGLFATRAFAPGETLCEYRGERITREASRRRAAARPAGAPVFTVTLDDTHDLDGDVPDNLAKYANHGCAPNAELVPGGAPGRLFLVALTAVAPGEEILFDYGFGLADSVAHPCRCGAPDCAGRIVAEPLRPLLKKHLRPPRR